MFAQSSIPFRSGRGYDSSVVYREQIVCAYCEAIEVVRCSRCECRLCENHRPKGEEGWCWACAKEIKDELDIEAFKMMIGTPNQRLNSGEMVPVEAWAKVAAWVATFKQRRMKKRLLTRSREQIEAWRKEAGIRTKW